MENITEVTLDKESMKRIRKRAVMNKVRFLWLLAFNIAGIILLYAFLYVTRGISFAVENIFLTIATILTIDVFGYGAHLVFLFFYEIPEEIFQQQRKVIAERLPNELALNIERTPNLLSRDGQDFRAIALLVTNQENKKIVEFQALINFEHFYYIPDRDSVLQTSYEFNAPLLWIGTEPAETEIELRPQKGKVVLVCELTNAKTGRKKKIDIALVGSNPTPTAVDFGNESIYHFRILFQGKLEGEYNFRTFYYKDSFYADPVKQKILFLNVAEKSDPNISKHLLDRSKEVIRFMENRTRSQAKA